MLSPWVVAQMLLLIITFWFIGGDANLAEIAPTAEPAVQELAVSELIKRFLPQRHTEFSVSVNPNLTGVNGNDVFEIRNSSTNGVHLIGNTGVSVANAFNYYLKTYCNCHIDWQISAQLRLPSKLPHVNGTVRLTISDRFRYYQNVCTSSYSFVWWSWTEWEKHLDWMALNGINLALASIGQEAIFRRAFYRFNITQTELDDYFTGPAFLSWLRMGNMQNFAGPLSESWHKRTVQLQHRILDRMRSFGMIPVLPAFAGFVPRGFREIFPTVKMSKVEQWNDFNSTYCCPYFVDPHEPLFEAIANAVIDELRTEFGTDHIYSCDLFNENKPNAGTDVDYVRGIAKRVYISMSNADPKAVWLLQNWFLVHDILFWTYERAKAFFTALPKGSLLILDLQSEQYPQYERFEHYFGHAYIWCMLHNFGGTSGMFGSSTIINERTVSARTSLNSTMLGIGLTPEGIHQNYVIYELMLENAWRTAPTDLFDWFRRYSIRRYGIEEPSLVQAWMELKSTVYDFKSLQRIRGQYAICRTPSLRYTTWNWYSFENFTTTWKNFLNVSNATKLSEGYLYDLVDVSRQGLQLIGDILYKRMRKNSALENVLDFDKSAQKYLDLLLDLERLLATNEHFLLGRWTEAAKACAETDKDRILFEYNARNQITLWGPSGEISNYATKQWSGIVQHVYYKRWKTFIDYWKQVLSHKLTFNQTHIRQKMLHEVELPFTLDRSVFPTTGSGNTYNVAKEICLKWCQFQS